MQKPFHSFQEFYPFYLSQHQKRGTRIMHFLGLSTALNFLALSLWNQWYWGIGVALALGYGPAVASHFIFEGNKPATRHNPIYSFFGDFRMCWDLVTGRERF